MSYLRSKSVVPSCSCGGPVLQSLILSDWRSQPSVSFSSEMLGAREFLHKAQVQGSSSTRLRRLDLAVSKLASSDFALRATPVLWPEAGPGLRSPLLRVTTRTEDRAEKHSENVRRRRGGTFLSTSTRARARLLTNQNLHYRNTYLSTREPPGGTRFPPA